MVVNVYLNLLHINTHHHHHHPDDGYEQQTESNKKENVERLSGADWLDCASAKSRRGGEWSAQIQTSSRDEKKRIVQ